MNKKYIVLESFGEVDSYAMENIKEEDLIEDWLSTTIGGIKYYYPDRHTTGLACKLYSLGLEAKEREHCPEMDKMVKEWEEWKKLNKGD